VGEKKMGMHACGTYVDGVKKNVWTREIKEKYKILHAQVLPPYFQYIFISIGK
jgi:hypothetical protein